MLSKSLLFVVSLLLAVASRTCAQEVSFCARLTNFKSPNIEITRAAGRGAKASCPRELRPDRLLRNFGGGGQASFDSILMSAIPGLGEGYLLQARRRRRGYHPETGRRKEPKWRFSLAVRFGGSRCSAYFDRSRMAAASRAKRCSSDCPPPHAVLCSSLAVSSA